jgi:hypothetical protein
MTIEDLILELELLLKLTEGLNIEIVSLSIDNFDGTNILIE